MTYTVPHVGPTAFTKVSAHKTHEEIGYMRRGEKDNSHIAFYQFEA
jgi:hypothetical protein